MNLRLHNSMTRMVEPFVPQDPYRVTMYVCGPTVYDTPHLGNARPAVVFDVLFRLLRYHYPQVVYARNFTDVDDKIMERAKADGERISDLTERTIQDYHEVTDALGVERPTHEPRATGAIDRMLHIIGLLIDRGHAYEAEGHVLFHVPSYPAHGLLSRHLQEDLEAGARVDPAAYKRHPSDFVMWKPSTVDQPGWDSSYGRGRPGWHIECSAMIEAVLGTTIDIHGGGADLRFPHHDCEISQSQCAHDGAPLARCWIHNGMLLIDGEKMAKSAGNFTTVRDVLDQGVPGAVIRLALLMTHYRSPLDWTQQLLREAATTLQGWHRALDGIAAGQETKGHHAPVLEALASDLNTPLAIAEMHRLAHDLRTGNPDERIPIAAAMREAGRILGFDFNNNDEFLRGHVGEEVRALIVQRTEARREGNWAEADRIRDVLRAKGVVLEDTPNETTWYKESKPTRGNRDDV
ncbi:cysteine--tRNA ligase [Microvirga sp. BT688]|uniref:cysteine--tRNA ligase n=1 Tax=Microvirga sp. TaxID=1873136 RepID=UPI0016872715|nr:cysteine--tRNA ligase [Microvirga sp.]MBD2750573.1 cysteine--tRNA ligase [Microvirga sp.]